MTGLNLVNHWFFCGFFMNKLYHTQAGRHVIFLQILAWGIIVLKKAFSTKHDIFLTQDLHE